MDLRNARHLFPALNEIVFLDTAAMGLLPDRRILVSMRYTSRIGEIRTSFHYFNDEDDVNRLLEALRESA